MAAAPTESRTPDRSDAPPEADRSAPAPEQAGVPDHAGATSSPFDDLPRPHLALEPDGPHLADFYTYLDLLTEPEREHLRRLRAYLASDVAPVVDEAWASDSFPDQLIRGFAGLDLAGLPYGLSGWSDEPARRVFMGFVHAEIARIDASTNSFFGVHSGLAMGSIDACGTPEQRERWLPPMARMETIGAFGLTEPHGGSDVAGGMETTARLVKSGEHADGEWVLDGHKRWIGNGTFADVIVIWARDVSDGAEGKAVRGFVVPRETEGLTTAKIEGKTSLRITQNADITLAGVRVPDENRLSGGKGTFADAGAVLRRTRGNASWACTGVQMASYELALSYAQEREQFGRPIAGFQMIQDALVQMLGNTTASLGMAARNAQLIDAGGGSDAHSALAKQFCADRMRETVALGRQVVGGNGIIVGNGIARYFADAEALYSYEGTREMNTLIVGKAVTGHSAFVR
jgi:glutaryl-CoA dehydrogenase